MVSQNLRYDEDYTPEKPWDGYGFTELDDNHCPECGEELGDPEEINGKYWPEENYWEVDAYKYTCPECGKVFFTKHEL
jgi:ribosomal protein S27AE